MSHLHIMYLKVKFNYWVADNSFNLIKNYDTKGQNDNNPKSINQSTNQSINQSVNQLHFLLKYLWTYLRNISVKLFGNLLKF